MDMLPVYLIVTSGIFLCIYIKPIDVRPLQPVNIISTTSTATGSAFDTCGWSIGGPEKRNCPFYDSYHWRCLANVKNCSSDTDYHCAKDLKGNWIEACDKLILCHEGEETQVVDGKVRCGYCEDRERYNPYANKPSSQFSQCPNEKEICDPEINGKVECDEPYKKNDPYSKYKMDRKCRCDYENSYIPRFYNLEKDTWRCIIASELECDKRQCPLTDDGRRQRRGEDYRCHPTDIMTKSPVETVSSQKVKPSGVPTTDKPTVTTRKPTAEKPAALFTFSPTKKITEKNKPDTTTAAEPDDDPDQKIWIICITVVGIICLVFALIVFIVRSNRVPVIHNTRNVHTTVQGDQINTKEVGTVNISQRNGGTDKEESTIDYVDYPDEAIGFSKNRRPADEIGSEAEKKPLNSSNNDSSSSIVIVEINSDPNKKVNCKDEPENRDTQKEYDKIYPGVRHNQYSDSNGTNSIAIDNTATVIVSEGENNGFENKQTPKNNDSSETKVVVSPGDQGDNSDEINIESMPSVDVTSLEPTGIVDNEAGVPGPPRSVGVVAIDESSVYLTWTKPVDHRGTEIECYIVQYKTSNDNSDWKIKTSQCKGCQYTVNGLLTGCEYVFRVIAINTVGRSEPSFSTEPVTCEPRDSVPGKPVGPLEATDITADSCTLTWKPPKALARGALENYQVEMKEPHKDNWDSCSKFVEGTNYRVTGLRENHKYLFRVFAESVHGKVGEALEIDEPVVARNPFTVPNKPENITATSAEESAVDLSWSKPNDHGGKEVIGYVIEYKESTSSDWRKKTSQTVNTELRIDGIKAGCEYEFRIRAQNAIGYSDASEVIRQVPRKIQYNVPGKPVGPLEATDINADSCTLTWKPSMTLGGDAVRNYVVEMKELCQDDWKPCSKFVEDTNYRVPGLRENHKYLFRVFAESVHGKVGEALEIDGAVVARNPFTVPNYPENIRATSTEERAVDLTWSKPNDHGGKEIIGYMIEYKESTSSEWSKKISQSVITELRIDGLKSGCEYEFRVRAQNAVGYSAASEAIRQVPRKFQYNVPGKPTGPLEATDVTADSCTLTWKPPMTEGGDEVRNYVVEMKELSQGDWKPCSKFVDGTNYRVIGLRENLKYLFRVFAESVHGKVGEALEIDEAVVARHPFTAPKKPENIKATSTEESAVDLSWSKPNDHGGKEIIGYVIEYKESTSSEWSKKTSQSVITQLRIDGLKSGCEYEIRVRAQNAVGYSDASEVIKQVPRKIQYNVPGKPTGPLEATDITADSCTLTWKPPMTLGDDAVRNYVVEMKELSEDDWKPCSKFVEGTNYRVPCLRENQKYLFRVFAESVRGKVGEALEIVEAVVARNPFTVPKKPEKIKSSSTEESVVDLSWSKPNDHGGKEILGYVVEYKESTSSEWSKKTSQSVITELRIDGLKSGCEYEFRVRAQNAVGNSGASEVIRQVARRIQYDVPGKPIGPLEATDITADSCTLTWKPPMTLGEDAVRNFRVEMKDLSEDDWKPCSKFVEGANYRVPGLRENHKYLFRVFAVSVRGEVGEALKIDEAVVACDPFTVPNRPENIKATSTEESAVDLSWSKPNDHGGKEIICYMIEYKESKSSEWSKTNSQAVITELRIDGLKSGCEYEFRVRAQNAVGYSDASEAIRQVPRKFQYNVPGKPIGPLEATDITADSCTLTWKPPMIHRGDEVRNYLVEMKELSQDDWKPCSKFVEGTNYSVIGLRENHKYLFRVFTESVHGKVGEALEIDEAVVARHPFTAPNKPENIKATSSEESAVDLSWSKPNDHGGKEIRGYVIEYKESTSREWSKKISQSVITELRIDGLKSGCEYEFRVRAQNAVGNSDASEVIRQVPKKLQYNVPGKPIGPLEATDITADSCTLTWKPPMTLGGDAIRNYVVEMKEFCQDDWKPCSKFVEGTNYRVPGLRENKKYLFRVFAESVHGKISEALEIDEAVVARNPFSNPCPPENIRAEVVNENIVFLTWTKPADHGGKEIKGYIVQYKTSNDSSDWKTKTAQCQECHYTVDSLIPGYEYVFRVTAINVIGQSEPSCSTEPVLCEIRNGAERSSSGLLTDEKVQHWLHTNSNLRNEDAYKTVIESLIIQFKENMDPDKILDGLTKYNIATRVQQRDIKAETKPSKKIDMILGLVISRGFEEYKVFKKILFETKHYDELEKMKLKEDEKIKWLDGMEAREEDDDRESTNASETYSIDEGTEDRNDAASLLENSQENDEEEPADGNR